jgi:hypothetical protein
VEGSCENGIEHSGSIKCWEVLEWLYNWQLLKKGSAPCVSKYGSHSMYLHAFIMSLIYRVLTSIILLALFTSLFLEGGGSNSR